MNKIYQIKILLKPVNQKFKSQIITGIVMANDRPTAVTIAMTKTEKVIIEKKMLFTPKLFSAITLPSDFIYYEESQEPTNEDTLNSEDHA